MLTHTAANKQTHTNALISEDSPYLLQHAHNPVDWYAWGDQAFQKAKKENKMIFLSIGYSTCHWCHVMEEESFEDEEVAKLVNKYFVSIKVDREEKPHIDKYYQDVHSLLNKRGGGWPLTIIMTPDAKAFFAATYIPNEAKHGRSGIKELLLKIQSVFVQDRQKVIQSSLEIERILKEQKKSANKKQAPLSLALVDKFVDAVEESFDKENFGIGYAPKFPHASTIDTLLDIYSIYKDERALGMATSMLRAMGDGGIYDQIEGGFYRYSVDDAWMIPHFEKMLYTNAEMLSAYAKAYKITKDKFYKEKIDEIIEFVKVRFEKENLFYSASDADSKVGDEKEEGAYFVFDFSDTKKHLEQHGYENSQEILDYFNITDVGNFEHNQNNPYLDGEKKPKNLKEIKKVLKSLRETKEYPFVDYKIITSWNAMYISALFEADYNKKAIKHLDTLMEKLYIGDVLYHQRILHKKPKVGALLEDYSFLITTLLKAYDYSLDSKYLDLSKNLTDEALSKFYREGNWYMSDDEFQSIAGVYDSSYKSALSNMLDNLLKVAILSEDLETHNIAKETLKSNSSTLSSNPANAAWLTRDYMAYKRGYVSLKGTKEMLKDKDLSFYPFIVKKVTKDTSYQACSVIACFAYSDDFETIKKKIKEFTK